MIKIITNLLLVFISLLVSFSWNTVFAEYNYKINESECKNLKFTDKHINKLQHLDKLKFDKTFGKSGDYWYEKFHTISILDLDGDKYCDLIIEESTPFPDTLPSKRGWYLSIRLHSDESNDQKPYEIELPPNKTLYYFNSYSINDGKKPYILVRTSYYPNHSEEKLTFLQWDSKENKWSRNTINDDKQLAIVKYYIQSNLDSSKENIVNFLRKLSKIRFQSVREGVSGKVTHYLINDNTAPMGTVNKIQQEFLTIKQNFNFLPELFTPLNLNNSSDDYELLGNFFSLNDHKNSFYDLQYQVNNTSTILQKTENIFFGEKLEKNILNINNSNPASSLLSNLLL